MRRRCLVASLALLVAGAVPVAAADAVPTDPRDRVEHHLRQVEELAQHFDAVMGRECPRFATPKEWTTYLDGEIDRVVLLVAHLEQAWIEAKRTGDDEVRRMAKAPRKRLDQARSLVDKLQQCAADNGTGFAPPEVWHRIERDVPKRQAEIVLPR